MTEAPAICFGRSSSVVFNKIDAPIELRARSLSRGRSVLNKSALRTPKDWTSPSESQTRQSTSLRSRFFDDADTDDEDDGRGVVETDGIMHPPSCLVAGLEATGRDEVDPDEASASWYKEAPRVTRQPDIVLRTERYPTSPTQKKEKSKMSIRQLEIEERFQRSRQSVVKALSSGTEQSVVSQLRVAEDIETEFASLTMESRNPPPTSMWEQLNGVATEIGSTFSDDDYSLE